MSAAIGQAANATVPAGRASFLIVGDVCGRFDELNRALASANQRHGPFNFALCSGDFFGEQFSVDPLEVPSLLQGHSARTQGCGTSNGDAQYVTGDKGFCLPLLFVDNSRSAVGEFLRLHHPSGLALTPTLEFLGAFGVKEIGSLRVAYLSGCYDWRYFLDEAEDELSIDPSEDSGDAAAAAAAVSDSAVDAAAGDSRAVPTPNGVPLGARYFAGPRGANYCVSVIQRLKEQFADLVGQIDVFLCGEWPTGLDSTLTPAEKAELAALQSEAVARCGPCGEEMSCAPAVAELIELLEPRYVVCSGRRIFYQRPLFSTTSKGWACRIICLGSLPFVEKSVKSSRYIHALCIKPLADTTNAAIYRSTPASSTPSPFFALYSHLHLPSSLPERHKRPWVSPEVTSPEPPSSAATTPQQQQHTSTPQDDSAVKKAKPDGQPQVLDLIRSMLLRKEESATNPKTETAAAKATGPSLQQAASPQQQQQQQLPAHRQQSQPQLPSAAQPSPQQQQTETPVEAAETVMVTNIPYVVDMESFSDVMRSFGVVTSLDLPRGLDGNSTGRAWVTYRDIDSAYAAVRASQQLESGGRLLRIQFSARRRQQQLQAPQPQPQRVDVRPHAECWFCLSNPKCERRLIVALGKRSYVALAKGGVVQRHVLVVPISHFPNLSYCPADVLEELDNFVSVLRRCFAALDLATLVYERHVPMRASTGMHMQLQVIPVPANVAPATLNCFLRKAERVQGATTVRLAPGDGLGGVLRVVGPDSAASYFYFEAPGDHWQSVCSFLLQNISPFSLPLTFGREIAAELLHVPERIEWRRCVETDDVETRQAAEMHNLLKPFLAAP